MRLERIVSLGSIIEANTLMTLEQFGNARNWFEVGRDVEFRPICDALVSDWLG